MCLNMANAWPQRVLGPWARAKKKRGALPRAGTLYGIDCWVAAPPLFPQPGLPFGFLLSIDRNCLVWAGSAGSPTPNGRFPRPGPDSSPRVIQAASESNLKSHVEMPFEISILDMQFAMQEALGVQKKPLREGDCSTRACICCRNLKSAIFRYKKAPAGRRLFDQGLYML